MEKLCDSRDTIGHYVVWYHHVTYRMPCHASGHLVIYRECYGFQKGFFNLRRSLPYTSSCWLLRFPGSPQFNIKVSRASWWSSKHSPNPTIRLNHNNPQKSYGGRFYLRVTAGWLNEESASYGIRTLSTEGEHVLSFTLYPLGHRAMRFELN